MTDKLLRWNITDHIKTAEAQALYLEACVEIAGSDSAFIIEALQNIAHAQGIGDLATLAGIDPASLFDGCELSFEAFRKISEALGLQINWRAR
jgi:probable addiction module antidote protein